MAEQSTTGQSKHRVIPSSSIVVPDVDNSQSQPNASNNNQDPKVKRNLIIIGVFAIIIVIVIIILIFTIEFNTDTDDNYYYNDWYYYDGDSIEVMEIGQVNQICGDHIDGKLFSPETCAINCTYVYNGIYAYYIQNTNECYCETYTQNWDKEKNSTLIDICYNVTNDTIVIKYETYMIAYGRPYNIENAKDLKAAYQHIDCNDYEFYLNEDEQWMQFISNNVKNSSIDVVNNWMEKAFSEHASIGTFAKFALELMNLGGPLWFLEMANKAALDEIEHAKISFDVLNMYLRNSGSDNGCVIYKEFPSHVVVINGDWNRISLDTAVGGCIGETLSAFTYVNEDVYYGVGGNVMNEYLNKIVMDEIRHASLAWVTVKWIIDQRNDVEVGNVEWWNRELVKRGNRVVNDMEKYVYREVIPSILNLVWNSNQNHVFVEEKDYYKELYNAIDHMMQMYLKMTRDSMSCQM